MTHASDGVDPSGVATGRLENGVHRLTLRVYYEDTDAGGVVYHANYLRFCERARTELLTLIGIGDMPTLAAAGFLYVVAEANLRYRSPARLGDILVIESWIEEIRRSRCVVKQRVIRNGDLLVEARIALVLIGNDWRPKAQPEPWLRAFAAVMGVDTPE